MPGKTILLAGTVLLGFGASACHRGDAVPAPAAVPAVDPSGSLRDYTGSYNQLDGLGGVAMTARWYAELDIPHRAATSALSFNPGLLDQGRAALKSARAASGGLPVVDARADALLGTLDRLLARLDALRPYYEGRSYRNDQLARGRREDPLLRAEFDAALAALQAFDVALAAARARQDATVLTRLQARGDRLGYATRLAVQQGGILAGLLPDAAASRDPRVLARADAAAHALEATLVAQRQAYASAAARAGPTPDQEGGPDSGPDSGHEQVARQLTAMVGSYRDLKQDHRVDDLDDLRTRYNGAVESAYTLADEP